jgi:hypothetical protein
MQRRLTNIAGLPTSTRQRPMSTLTSSIGARQAGSYAERSLAGVRSAWQARHRPSQREPGRARFRGQYGLDSTPPLSRSRFANLYSETKGQSAIRDWFRRGLFEPGLKLWTGHPVTNGFCSLIGGPEQRK